MEVLVIIYTCTLNPSIDYNIRTEKIIIGQLNRVNDTAVYPGGKGINVSIVLHNLGLSSRLLGFIGGFTGAYIEDELRKLEHLNLSFQHILGNTRINVKLKGEKETEINASGPFVDESDYEALLEKVDLLTKEDVFILSGSVPVSLHHDVYKDIAARVSSKNATLIVDSTKEQLLKTLPFKPFLIKPNKKELEDLFKETLESDIEIIHAARILIEKGAENVLVSLGGDGAILVTQKAIYKSPAPTGKLVNSVGAGDSMVAGFIFDYLKTKSLTDAFMTAVACGSATAFSEGLATKESIDLLRKQIEIKQIKET